MSGASMGSGGGPLAMTGPGLIIGGVTLSINTLVGIAVLVIMLGVMVLMLARRTRRAR